MNAQIIATLKRFETSLARFGQYATGLSTVETDDRDEAAQALADVRQVRAALAKAAELEDDRDDYRERLRDLVMIDAEERATGGGPGFKQRAEAAWTRAREPFEP